MEFFRHWARLREDVSTPRGHREISAVGWSNDSEKEAQQLAKQRLAMARERIMVADPPRRGEYGYSDGRPLREEVVSELAGEAGSPLAVITRNGYGSLVLNTQRVLFIDVDFEHVPAQQQGFFQKLFGGTQSPEQRALSHVEKVAADYPQWSFRVYRTAAGLRVVLLTELVDAKDEKWLSVLKAFGTDPMYLKLCRTQESFRARLTPKAWRCGYPRPYVRFPAATERDKSSMERWLSGYQRVCESHGTCRLLTTIGVDQMPHTVAKVLNLHDMACVREGLPLA